MDLDQLHRQEFTRRKMLHAGMAALVACPASALSQEKTGDAPFRTPSEPVNSPLGTGKGVQPGRVTWAHQPKVATWDGKTGNWWDDANTNAAMVDAMLSGSLRSLAGEKSDREAWRALFASFQEARKIGGSGYRPGEKVAVKLNSNQDRPGAWRFASGMPSPQVVYSLVHQLITVAGVRGEDLTLIDASRYIGDPIYNRIRANPDPNFQAVRFEVSQRMAGNGRAEALPDKANPVNFSQKGVPTAYLPQSITAANYLINVALSRAHTLMGATQTAKNLFGTVYFDGPGFTPQPLHDFASRDRRMGSYNCLVDLISHQHLGGKTVLYLIDFLYVAVSQNEKVIRYASFDNQWCASIFASQDPVAIDSVGLDFIRNEPTADECRGYPENYLHEAALAEKPPSGTVYRPDGRRDSPLSLGVHEHWNNTRDRQYSRNLGKREGIELVKV